MRRFARGFLVPFLVLAIPLGTLAGLGFLAAHRQLERTREAAVGRTLDAVTALVADYQDSLRRETVLLARDPAVVEGTAKGDWTILSRGASPRVLAVTRDGLADFITIRDARGTPLMQVPASPPPSLPGAAPATEPVLTLRLAGGQPYFLVTAPVMSPAEREARGTRGTVVAGRRLEGLGPLLERLPARPAVIFVAGDRTLAASRADLPTGGWARAVTVGTTEVGDEPFAVRRLGESVATSPDGGLWVLLPVREFAHAERRLLLEFLALLGAGAVVLAGVVLAFLPPAGRPRPGAGPRADSPGVALERRNRELEALNAVFSTMSRGADLATTAGEMLEVVRGLARMDIGAIYRLDRDGNQLVLEGQSGFDPRHLDRARTRPLDGSQVGVAARTGQILVTHLDAAPPSEEGIREMAVERAHRTQLAVPIPVENLTWGVMALVSQEQCEFTPEEMTILSGVAQQVGLAVERAQLRDMAGARLNRLEAQRVIERHISEQLDTEELLVVIAGSAQRLIGGAYAALYLLEGDTLRPRAWSDVGDWIRDLRFKVGTGAVGSALASGRGVLVNDYSSSPHAVTEFVPFTSRLLAAPLMAGGRALGVMTAGRGPGAPPFTEEDLSTLTDFATQAAVALEHARLFDEATRNAAQYQALLEVSGAVSSTLEVDRVLDLVVDRCRALLGVAAVGVMRVERETGTVAYERGCGLSSEFTASLRMRLGEGTTGRAIEQRVPVWSEDVLHDPALAITREARALIEREGYRAVLSVPLLTKGDAHGAIAAYWWEPHTPSAGEISIMTALAGQAATALDNARLFQDNQRRVQELSVLHELSSSVTGQLDQAGILDTVYQQVARVLGVQSMAIVLLDEERDRLAVGLRVRDGRRCDNEEPHFYPRDRCGLSGYVFETGRPIRTTNYVADCARHGVAALPAAVDLPYCLIVPMTAGDRVLGVLSLRSPDRAFTDADERLLVNIAHLLALMLRSNQLVQQVLETTESIWRQDSRRRGVEIEVETDLAQGLPRVAGDPADLREAFTNLLLNAVDAMPGGGTLTLRTGAAEGQVRVEVGDTGAGIPEHIREKIFDPFFTTKGPKGTGLGLSMAYGILQRHGGRITVESNEGRGSLFRLLFPATASDPVGEAAPPPAAPAGSPVPLHCLVVDDEEEVAEVVGDILTTAGHTAVTARSGQEGVERLRAERFDVVFTDLAMPGMTGWQVARAVKDRAPEVPVVMMSGFGVQVAPDDLHTHGVDLVLAKPLQIQDVLRALGSIRRGSRRS